LDPTEFANLKPFAVDTACGKYIVVLAANMNAARKEFVEEYRFGIKNVTPVK
jgi:hypothetical protein